MIIRLSKSDTALIEQTKELWHKCFNDSTAFLDYYYNGRTAPENILCSVERGRVTGMLHMIPRTVMKQGKRISVTLIAGVATDPEFRGSGIAHALLNKAESVCNAEALILKPADDGLFKFYGSIGYRGICRYTEHLLDFSDFGQLPETALQTPTAQHLLEIYNDFACNFDSYELRDKKYFQSLINETAADKSSLCVCTQSAYAFCNVENGICEAYEAVGTITPELISLIKMKSAVQYLKLTYPYKLKLISVAAECRDKDTVMIKYKSSKADFGNLLSYFSY